MILIGVSIGIPMVSRKNAMTALCLSGVHFREPAVGVSRCGTDCAVSCLSRFPEAFWCVGGSVRPT